MVGQNREFNSSTELYGVLGFPVKHSKSPLIFNRAFAQKGINAVYLAFEQRDTEAAIKAVRALGIKGLSVTLPHKERALDCVDAVDETGERMGCINTIVNRDGILTGYNYDGDGALAVLKKKGTLSADVPIYIAGAGGAARGIAFALAAHGCRSLVFCVRSAAKAAPLVSALSAVGTEAEVISFAEAETNGFPAGALLINTTPVGMAPAVEESIVSQRALRGEMTVYDIVYTPKRTRLILDAQAAGAEVIYGTEMFLGQASLQYRLWLGDEAPVDEWRALLESIA